MTVVEVSLFKDTCLVMSCSFWTCTLFLMMMMWLGLGSLLVLVTLILQIKYRSFMYK